MDVKEYTGEEWTRLSQLLTVRQLRNALKRSYRAVGKRIVAVAVSHLHASGLQGSGSDWDKGIRIYTYSKGGGFMATVKGVKGKSMHENRQGLKRPVLMWAEEGTKERRTRGSFLRRGRATGSMPAYGFLAAATPEMFQIAETDLGRDLETAVTAVARRAGFI